MNNIHINFSKKIKKPIAKKSKHSKAKTLSNKTYIYIIISLLIFLLAQIPFLNADPDINVDLHTRGAWTDEGLYTSQITNYINTGNFNIKENNQFIVSPFFNVLIYPFYLLFGNKIIVSRVVVIIFWFLSLLIFFKKKEFQIAGLIFIPLALFQYQIFHFSHYSMPEMICISFVLLSFAVINQYFYSKSKNVFLIILSAFTLFLAYCTKIQFLSSALILPAAMFFYSIIENKKGKLLVRFKPFFVALFTTLILFIIYVVIWYLPHQEFYNHVWAYETDGRFPESIIHLWQIIKFHSGFTFWTPQLKPLIIFFAFGLILTPFVFMNKEGKKHLGAVLFLLFWLFAEFAKVSAAYLPYRYLLSLIIASSLLTAFVISFFINKFKLMRYIVIAGLAIIFTINVLFIYDSYTNKTYDIAAVNQYLKNYNFQNKTILGVWSHTLARSTKAQCITVKRNYLNFHNPIEHFKPVIVATEHDEADSDSVFIKQDVFLDKLADSSVSFHVWKYKINLYWLKPQINK